MASSFMKQLRESPATQELMDSVTKFAGAQATSVAPKIANKVAGGGKTGDTAEGAVTGIQNAKDKGKGELGKLFGGIGGAVKGLFKGKGKGSSSKRPTNIVENMLIGAPVELVFERWTAYQEMASYMKAVEAVDTGKDKDKDKDKDKPKSDEEQEQQETSWKVKVWWSRRSWKATTVEQTDNERIKWKTEAAKGTVDGVVTFTPLGDNLTMVLVVIEYRSKGMFEWTANRWRAVGRRVRLDLKHFRRYVMMGEQPPPETPEGEPELADKPENDTPDMPEETNEEPAPDMPEESEPDTPEPATEKGPRKPQAPRTPAKVSE